MNIVDNAGLFLISSVFDIYIFIVMLRIMLQWVSADFTNPVFKFVVRLTNLPLSPMRRVIPILHGIDIAAIILLVLLEFIKLFILVWIQIAGMPTLGGLIVLAFAEILGQGLNIFFYAILALAILSWFSPLAHSPIIDTLHRLSNPLLRPVQRILPYVAGFDLSPIPVLIGLKLLTILIVMPLMRIGIGLALGT